ncbi:MAG: hypothetical protein ACE5GA_09120 [Candidatus Zixiibacteriota bacterium]
MFIPPELFAYCLVAGAIYLLLIDLVLTRVERILAHLGLWEKYPAELTRAFSGSSRLWNLATQFFLYALLPTLAYSWFYLLLPFEGPRSGIAIGLWTVALGAAPMAIYLGSRLRLPLPALVFFTFGHLVKLCGSLAIIGFLFSL